MNKRQSKKQLKKLLDDAAWQHALDMAREDELLGHGKPWHTMDFRVRRFYKMLTND